MTETLEAGRDAKRGTEVAMLASTLAGFELSEMPAGALSYFNSLGGERRISFLGEVVGHIVGHADMKNTEPAEMALERLITMLEYSRRPVAAGHVGVAAVLELDKYDITSGFDFLSDFRSLVDQHYGEFEIDRSFREYVHTEFVPKLGEIMERYKHEMARVVQVSEDEYRSLSAKYPLCEDFTRRVVWPREKDLTRTANEIIDELSGIPFAGRTEEQKERLDAARKDERAICDPLSELNSGELDEYQNLAIELVKRMGDSADLSAAAVSASINSKPLQMLRYVLYTLDPNAEVMGHEIITQFIAKIFNVRVPTDIHSHLVTGPRRDLSRRDWPARDYAGRKLLANAIATGDIINEQEVKRRTTPPGQLRPNMADCAK